MNDKVKIINDKKYFNAPLDENNKPYWIPIVIKNKDYLIGFMNAYDLVCDLHGFNRKEIDISLSSDRFNDILLDGTRMQTLSREELKKKLRILFYSHINATHQENSADVLSDDFLSVSCTCGMYYSFKDENDIPLEDTKCTTCGKYILMYTNMNDSEFTFDGESGDINKIIKELNNEIER